MNRLVEFNNWKLGDHWLPHDSMAHEGSTGRTRFEQFKEATRRFEACHERSGGGRHQCASPHARPVRVRRSCLRRGPEGTHQLPKEWDEESGIWRDKRRYDTAIEQAEFNLLRTQGANFSRVILAAAYAQLNRVEDATRARTIIRRLDPTFDPQEFGTKFLSADDLRHVREGLQKAGLDEARPPASSNDR